MTLLEFVNTNIGKAVDFDGYYGAQCVDLFRQYNKDVLGFPHTGAVNGAKDIVEKYNLLPIQRQFYDLIRDPHAGHDGDIVVFGSTSTNKYGHVAIVVKAEEDMLFVFEQDGYNQHLGAKLKLTDVSNVIGYLHPKNA